MSIKSKVFMIIGKSNSGKNTLLNTILSDKEFCDRNNLYQLIRYTTRKPRPDEIDGHCGYHFISDKEYDKKYKNRGDVVITSFDSEFGLLHYIADLSELDSSKNYILDADPGFIEPFKKLLGNRLCVIYIIPPDWVLMQRFGERKDNSEYTESKYKEITRRFIDDISRFNTKANLFLANCNCIINIGREYLLERLENCIEQYSNNEWNNICLLLTKSETAVLSNNYEEKYKYCTSLNMAVEGILTFHNGNVIIDTNAESYSIVDSSNLIFKSKYLLH